MKQNNPNTELKELSPFLSNIKDRQDGMKVPKNYFEQLPNKVIDRVNPKTIAAPSDEPAWLLWLRQLLQPKPVFALASVLAVVVAIGLWQSSDEGPKQAIALADISTEALEEWTYNNTGELPIEIISSVVGEMDLEVLLSPQDPEEQLYEELLKEMDLEDLL